MINLPARKPINTIAASDLTIREALIHNECLDEVIRLNPDPKPVPLPTHVGLWITEGESSPSWIAFNETGKPYYRSSGGYCKVGRWIEVHLPTFPEPEKPPAPERVTLYRSLRTTLIQVGPCGEAPDSLELIGCYVREESK